MSELDLISKIRKNFSSKDSKLVKSIGDDCAVIDRGDKYEIITTDMYVEEDHFSLKWSSPKQIGIKAYEATVSDIAAMGGLPKYLLVSLCISKKVNEKQFVEEFYKGFKSRINYWNKKLTTYHLPLTTVIGGDLTHGDLICVNVTAIGEVEKNKCIMRSGAKPGDLICVTGTLGKSWAGLEYLRKKEKEKRKKSKNAKYKILNTKYSNFCVNKNLEPHCRLDASQILKNYASSMIDISDGLASEVRHICEESKTGAIVYKEKIPLSKQTKEIAKFLDKDPYKWALSGGEDFELCFTISKENYKKLTAHRSPLTAFILGKILPKSKGIHLIDSAKKIQMPKGYEHF